jgi:hypothetical protein
MNASRGADIVPAISAAAVLDANSHEKYPNFPRARIACVNPVIAYSLCRWRRTSGVMGGVHNGPPKRSLAVATSRKLFGSLSNPAT